MRDKYEMRKDIVNYCFTRGRLFGYKAPDPRTILNIAKEARQEFIETAQQDGETKTAYIIAFDDFITHIESAISQHKPTV